MVAELMQCEPAVCLVSGGRFDHLAIQRWFQPSAVLQSSTPFLVRLHPSEAAPPIIYSELSVLAG